MTSKQRAYLRSMANTMDVVLYVGKEGVTANTIKEAYDVLESREIIKCSVQQGAPVGAKEACAQICEKTGAEPIQCIGRKFVIYRESRENKRIDLSGR
jgi:Predicted RNA-binding protein containing KH domain, possibly ribosomal protein